MSKNLLIIALIISTLSLSVLSCKKTEAKSEKEQYRLIAWNAINLELKATVTINWEDAIVEKYSYSGQEAVVITFATTQDATLGPIQVFIAVKGKKVLGIGSRF